MRSALHLIWAAAFTLETSRRITLASRRDGDQAVVRLAHDWAERICARTGIEIVSTGSDAVDWTRPCIVMASHQSYLDILALVHVLPRPLGFVAKKELFRIPLFGKVMEVLGCVAVDRKRNEQAVEALHRAAAEVRAGKSISVFPEGTRSGGDRIGPMKKGPFHLAQAAGVPTIPIGIRGTAALMPRSATGIQRGKIEVHVGTPIPPIAPEGAEARAALAARVRSELCRLTELPPRDH